MGLLHGLSPRARTLPSDGRFQYGRNAAHWTQPLPRPWRADADAVERLKKFHHDLQEVRETLLELFAVVLRVSLPHLPKEGSQR